MDTIPFESGLEWNKQDKKFDIDEKIMKFLEDLFTSIIDGGIDTILNMNENTISTLLEKISIWSLIINSNCENFDDQYDPSYITFGHNKVYYNLMFNCCIECGSMSSSNYICGVTNDRYKNLSKEMCLNFRRINTIMGIVLLVMFESSFTPFLRSEKNEKIKKYYNDVEYHIYTIWHSHEKHVVFSSLKELINICSQTKEEITSKLLIICCSYLIINSNII
jgi:hypothetical protein